MCVKELPEYYKLVLNTLCVINFMTLSVIVLAVAANNKISIHNKIVIEYPTKRKKRWRLENFIMDFHLKECMAWKS